MSEDIKNLGSCEICGKAFEIKKYVFWVRKTCSIRCRQIRWALAEANKIFKARKLGVLFFALVLQGTYAYTKPAACDAAEIKKGVASWYSVEACRFNPDSKCPTASGKSLYDLEKLGENFAAMWDVPFGSKFKVRNARNGKSTVVTILDRGAARRLNRAIDLSKKAFSEIADLKTGVINVELERLL